jgi:hypothetical protein
MATKITIRDKKVLRHLTHDADQVRDLVYDIRAIDAKSKRAGLRYPTRRCVRHLLEAAENGITTDQYGDLPSCTRLVKLGLLEEIPNLKVVDGANEKTRTVRAFFATPLGLDVIRYLKAVNEVDYRDSNALRDLGVRGRKAMFKIRETQELPKGDSMLEDLFYAGMLERIGRGGKPLSAKRAKEMRAEPLERDKLRPTERFRRCVEQVTKTGSYVR